MATTSPTIVFDNSTDALFRAWVAAMISNIVAVGYVQTTDTGQIDTATVLKPSTTAQSKGYAMFSTNDAFADMFLKVEFGSGGATLAPTIYVTMGWSTDGAGSLSGTQLSTRNRMNITSNSGVAITAPCVFAGNGSYLTFALDTNATGGFEATIVVLERSKTAATGADNGNGAIIVWAGPSLLGVSGLGMGHQYVPSTGGIPAAYGRPTGPQLADTDWARGTAVGVTEHIPWNGGGEPVGVGFLMYGSANFTRGTQDSVSLYGVARNYFFTGQTCDTSYGTKSAILYQ